jgi:hypothetical protein
MIGAFRLIYRRPDWDPATGPKIRPCGTLGEVLMLLRQLRKTGPVQARVLERTRGRWREIAIPEGVEG